MYSTLYSTSTVHCTVQSVLLLFARLKFIWGRLAHCTVQGVSLFFARLNFIGGGGGLSPPALITRRPWFLDTQLLSSFKAEHEILCFTL